VKRNGYPEPAGLTGTTIFVTYILLPIVSTDVHLMITWFAMQIGSGIGYSLPGVRQTVDVLKLFVTAKGQKRNGAVHLRDIYEDEDGAATEKGEREYSDALPKRTFYVAAVGGFVTSFTSSASR
jgi:hypothetical protein